MNHFTTAIFVTLIIIVIVLAPAPVKAMGIAGLLLVVLLYGTDAILHKLFGTDGEQ